MLLKDGSLKVPGYTPVAQTTGTVDVMKEAQAFSATLKWLRVNTQGLLVIPSDSEIAGHNASAAVFELLQKIREESKDLKGLGSTSATTQSPTPQAQQGNAATQGQKFPSLDAFPIKMDDLGVPLFSETSICCSWSYTPKINMEPTRAFQFGCQMVPKGCQFTIPWSLIGTP